MQEKRKQEGDSPRSDSDVTPHADSQIGLGWMSRVVNQVAVTQLNSDTEVRELLRSGPTPGRVSEWPQTCTQ